MKKISYKKNIVVKKILKLSTIFWGNLEKYIGFVILISMTTIIFIQVISRYVFFHSFFWSEEVTRFLMIWMTFAGSAYAFKKGAHIGVNFFVDRLPDKLRFLVKVLSRLITIGFFFLLLYYGTIHTLAQLRGPQLSAAMRMSMAIPYSAIPIGSFFVIVRLIYMLILEIKSFKKEGEN